MICQPLVAGGEVDDAAVGEAVGEDAVLHYTVVAVGVDLDVAVFVVCETPVHDSLEDAVGGGGAADAVDDVVGKGVVKPVAFVDGIVGRFGGRDEGKVGDDVGVIDDNVAVVIGDVV